MRCLSTFSVSGWAYGFTLTLLPPQLLPQIWENRLKSYLMQVCKPYHYALVEAVEPCKLHPMYMPNIYEVFEHLLRLWMGIWLHIHIFTSTCTSPDLCELAEIWPYASVQTMHYKAVKPFKLHPISMSYIYERFNHLLGLCMGIWLHTHTITTTETSPDLWELAEILSNASVQTMPLHFGWGCSTFQTASHIHGIPI